MRKPLLVIFILALPVSVALLVHFLLDSKPAPTSRNATGQVTTLAGAGYPGIEDGANKAASFGDPFGIAVDKDGNVIVADGGQSNRIRRITQRGAVETIAGSEEGYADGAALASSFNTPSAVAIDKSGNIIIADTSNNRIRKLSTSGQVTTIAGSGSAGYKDGAALESEFDGPLGVAVDEQGNIFVADAYNDRIRKLSADGLVSTVSGTGSPGYKDGAALESEFDTPCGVAVDQQGNIFIADTGNHRIRKITPSGEVITVTEAQFDRPIGLAITHDGFLFVADEGSASIQRLTPEGEVSTIAGAHTGFADGLGEAVRFNGPSGVAVDRDGHLYVADTQNYLIRRIIPVDSKAPPAADSVSAQAAPDSEQEKLIQPNGKPVDGNPDTVIPRLNAALIMEKLNAGQQFFWPLNPQNQWHEVTGVVGEARGAPGGVALHHLHSGLDVRGNMGEPVVSIYDEKISSPLANWDFNGANEGIRIGLMSYIHIRVGRDIKDVIQIANKFRARFDESGKLAGLRIRRGTRFRAGDFIGTLNRLYHVHLNFGPWNAQANPIEFPFINFKDTIAPVIEPDGVEVVDLAGIPFKQKRDGRLLIRGDVDIVVTAYDRVDGNASQRKLGIYKLGYQILKNDGSAVAGFDQPVMNIEFNRMPPGDESVFITYAPGSGVSAYGTPTKFKYYATNRIRDGEARDGLLRTSELAPGDYIIKVIAEDYSGNRASGKLTELAITVEQ